MEKKQKARYEQPGTEVLPVVISANILSDTRVRGTRNGYGPVYDLDGE